MKQIIKYTFNSGDVKYMVRVYPKIDHMFPSFDSFDEAKEWLDSSFGEETAKAEVVYTTAD